MRDADTGPSPAGAPLRLCAVLTSFNRRETTLAGLQALQNSAAGAAVQLSAWLVDDGSSDGTADAVRARFPWVRVDVNAGPPLYWCRGTHRALAAALGEMHDHYLLLNDDTVLLPDAIARLLACARALRSRDDAPALVVGSTSDARTGRHTYGGQHRAAGWRRTAFIPVAPGTTPQSVDTFNGNVVLISAEAAARVGNLDPVFEHAMGDIDYGLRARAAGLALWMAPGVHGTCSKNSIRGTFDDPALPFRARWRLILGRKGLPWRSWLYFTRQHCGWLWPMYFAWPYVRLLVQGPLRRSRSGAGTAV